MKQSPPRSTKILLTIAAVVTFAVPAIADLNATHMFNPLWPPHARLHGAALLLVNIASGAISLFLLWGSYAERGSRLAVRFAALLPAMAWGALLGALPFPGTSSYPDGMTARPPINGNLVIAGVMVVLCVLGVVLDGRARRTS
jgi:hypothetical protein